MLRSLLLDKLPPFQGVYELVSERQTVGQIIKEVLKGHVAFYRDYDKIATEFYYPDTVKTFKALFNFLKSNVSYREEREDKQTVSSPSAIISLGEGDCKHYAGFIGGVLDALQRKGVNADWWYRFASYDPLSSEPGHVFVIAEVDGVQYWIDPVLSSFNQRLKPFHFIDRKISIPTMALYKVSGVGEDYQAQYEALTDDDSKLDPDLVRAIQVLLHYGVLTPSGMINDNLLEQLHTTLPKEQFDELVNARIFVGNATMGGLFSFITRGIKKVSLFVPRSAFLSMVTINAFGYATKLKAGVWDAAGHYTEFKDKVKDIWQNKFGGDWSQLERAILRGAPKRAILGCVDEAKIGVLPAAVVAWATAASAVIAAILPILNKFLAAKQAGTALPGYDPTQYPYGVCADGFTPKMPDGTCPDTGISSGNIIDKTVTWVKANPIPAAGIGVGAFYLIKKFVLK